MKEFLNSFFSIKEDNKSSVVFAMVVFVIIGAYKIITSGDIPSNLTTVLITAFGMICAVNVGSNITSTLSNKNADLRDK